VSILLTAAEPTIEEWNQIIATVQQHKLTWLNLSYNKIVVIPNSSAHLRNLKALRLWRMISVRLQCACSCVLTSQ
jgi:hypothetical protein